MVGSSFVGSGANGFDVSGHGVGMLFIASNFSVPFATARFDVTGNGVGILLTDNTDAFVVGGLNVRGNQIGLLGDGAGVVRLQQNDDNQSAIADNAFQDLLMTFGTRLDLRPDVVFGSLGCDPTVITPLPGPATPPAVACP